MRTNWRILYGCLESLSCESLTGWLLGRVHSTMYLDDDEYNNSSAHQKWDGDVKKYLDNNLYGVVGMQTR